ncbi:MAG: COQ9 family protein [Alphaproteobacteria bacterium]|nr:COQ9 family protein [Alphaproteobacteria bacterium]
MTETAHKSEKDHLDEARSRLLAAILPNIPFDGWSEKSFATAQHDSGIEPALANLACPRGVLDLALANHRQGDAEMVARAKATDLTALRYSARVAALVRFRLEAAADPEIVRRGVTFFAIPAHAAEGAEAIWQTCDLIWNTLGDTSDDLNWYSKRAILSAVYSSTLLFWLGDESEDHLATWQFLDRRIGNVMQFEKFKAGVQKNPLMQAFMRGPGKWLDKVQAPGRGNNRDGRPDLPGFMAEKS